MAPSLDSPDFAALDVIDLTTTGRVTGRPHRIEIWFALDGTTLFMLANSEQADWVQNLMRTPAVTISAAGTDHAGTARPINGSPEDRRTRDMLFTKYNPDYDGDLSEWRETAFPVAVDLEPAG